MFFGLKHRYKKSRGVFTGIKPKNSFRPLQGEWGALELAFRYSYLVLKETLFCGIGGLFTPLNARPIEYGVYSIGAKPIYLGCARRARVDNAFLRVPFNHPLHRRLILTSK